MRDEKKVTESAKQKDTNMEAAKTGSPEDVYEFKSVKESDSSPDAKSGDNSEVGAEGADTAAAAASQTEEGAKRNFSEVSDGQEEGSNDEESRRKKRKEEGCKEAKGAVAQRVSGQAKSQGGKQVAGTQGKAGQNQGAKSS